MAKPNLSYVIATRNKLAFLREVLARLTAHVQEDEEIVVVDGASTDGSREYLRVLHEAHQIHQYLSEADAGEAHALNKALMMAGGRLIKILTDDDAFHWPAIQRCKAFMLAHPEVDLLGTEGAGTWWADPDPFGPSRYQDDYRKWVARSEPFGFCGLGLMIRRGSLPLVGLFHTGFVRVDAELSLRVTSGPATLAWYTGHAWVRITNPRSNSVTHGNRIDGEWERLEGFYIRGRCPGRDPRQGITSHIHGFVGLARRALLARFPRTVGQSRPSLTFPDDWPSVFEKCDKWLEIQELLHPGKFLYRCGRELAIE